MRLQNTWKTYSVERSQRLCALLMQQVDKMRDGAGRQCRAAQDAIEDEFRDTVDDLEEVDPAYESMAPLESWDNRAIVEDLEHTNCERNEVDERNDTRDDLEVSLVNGIVHVLPQLSTYRYDLSYSL